MNITRPIVVILGATGSGKTKLSIELAKKFNTEIISADSMQLYKGLNIITAKASAEEQKAAVHHLIDILHPHDVFTVFEYRSLALDIIDNLHARNKLPIIVGGTNYYIEALLWKILVTDPEDRVRFHPGIADNNEHELSSQELHDKLKLLDPDMARRLHPHNKRKILRSLEVLRYFGRKHSDILKEQQSSRGGSSSGGPMRYENAVILWLRCNQEILDQRLDKRVDAMLEQGLLDELENFHKLYNETRIKSDTTSDYTKGVFQSIGFKEFHDYLSLTAEVRSTDKGKELFQKSVDLLKLVTRRYARKQCKWIRNRFLSRPDRNVPPLYGLSTDDVNKWKCNVEIPATEIIESFLNATPCGHSPLPQQSKVSVANADDLTYHCEVCDRIFVGTHQWLSHVRSNRHKKAKENRRSTEEECNL